MDLQPWRYFLSIENQLVQTIDFVDLHPLNSNAFSNEYVKLLLLAGSEVDVVAKMICAGIPGHESAKGIDLYRRALTARFVGIGSMEIDVGYYPTAIKPWESWSNDKTPDWWDAHNNVKHRRNVGYSDANQLNVLKAVCGLFALLLYLYRDLLYDDKKSHMLKHPQLVSHPIFPQFLLGRNEYWKPLPGA